MASALLLLSACGTNSELLTSSGERTDDVYFPEKEEVKTADKEQKERVTTASARNQEEEREQPDYYDPDVADQLEWRRLQRRNDFYHRFDRGYRNDGYYRSPAYRGGRGSNVYYRFPVGGHNPSTQGGQNNTGGGSSTGGGSDSDSDSGSERDRSYDSSDPNR